MRARRCVVAIALTQYLVICLGVPLPVLDRAPQAGMRYPCEGHHCGCPTPEQCWRDCCCMSMAEKIAWARENHVEVPDFVWAIVAKEEPAKPHCKACCCKARHDHGDACAAADERQRSASSPVVRWVVLIQAQRCRGHADSWLTASGVIGIPVPMVHCPADALCVPLVAAVRCLQFPEPASPPEPPPRAA